METNGRGSSTQRRLKEFVSTGDNREEQIAYGRRFWLRCIWYGLLDQERGALGFGIGHSNAMGNTPDVGTYRTPGSAPKSSPELRLD